MKIFPKILNMILVVSFVLLTFSSPAIIAEENRVIYLVRHAEKQADGTKDPDLTAVGLIRANNIAEQLKSKNITRIYSTIYKRTKNTAKPLAELLNIQIELYDPRDLDSFAKEVLKDNHNIVIVGHSNTTPYLVNLLGGESHGAIDETMYDRLYEITYLKGKPNTVLLKSSNSN